MCSLSHQPIIAYYYIVRSTIWDVLNNNILQEEGYTTVYWRVQKERHNLINIVIIVISNQLLMNN